MLSGTPLAASRLLRGRTGRRDETPPSKVYIFGKSDGVGVLDGADVVCVCLCVCGGGTRRRDETSKVFIFGADHDDFTS